MRYLLIGFVLFLSSTHAFASGFWCTGKVTRVWVNNAGGLYISSSYRKDHTQLCGQASEWKGVSTDTCKSWQSILQTALVTKRNVTIYYSNIESCAAIPTYGAAPAPGYVMLIGD